jgi:hypothetical protein
VLTVLKTVAGLAALLLVLLGLLAAIGGAVGFIRRALKGPGSRITGLPQPREEKTRGGGEED